MKFLVKIRGRGEKQSLQNSIIVWLSGEAFGKPNPGLMFFIGQTEGVKFLHLSIGIPQSLSCSFTSVASHENLWRTCFCFTVDRNILEVQKVYRTRYCVLSSLLEILLLGFECPWQFGSKHTVSLCRVFWEHSSFMDAWIQVLELSPMLAKNDCFPHHFQK